MASPNFTSANTAFSVMSGDFLYCRPKKGEPILVSVNAVSAVVEFDRLLLIEPSSFIERRVKSEQRVHTAAECFVGKMHC